MRLEQARVISNAQSIHNLPLRHTSRLDTWVKVPCTFGSILAADTPQTFPWHRSSLGGGVMEEWSTPVNTIHERTCWLDERFQILDSNNAQLSGIDPSSDVFERHMNSFGERMFSQKTANYKTTKKAPCWMCGLIWSWYGVCISKQNDTHVLTSGSSLKVGPVDAGAGAGAVVTDTLLW